MVIDDVELPKWASTPEEFVMLHRAVSLLITAEVLERLTYCLLSKKTTDLLEVKADVSIITYVLSIILLRVPHVLMLNSE